MSNRIKYPRRMHCGHFCRLPEDRNPYKERGPRRTPRRADQLAQAQASIAGSIARLITLPAAYRPQRGGRQPGPASSRRTSR